MSTIGNGRRGMSRSFQVKSRAAAYGLCTLAGALVLLLAMLPSSSSYAQDITPDMLRALQQHAGGEDTDRVPSPTATTPNVQTFQPATDQPPPPGSHLEEIYTARAGRDLKQVGYGTLGAPATVSIAQSGAAPDTYVLGIGDELVVTLRGQENASYRQRVDRDGRVVLPKLTPISAAGHTFADFRSVLEAMVARSYVSTSVFVSLGEAHQISVLVAGFVRTPGARVMSAFGTPIDAILLSGGIGKSGTLRSVQLIRGGITRTIDLYPYVVRGGAAPPLPGLQDGDRIFVPALGATVAIAGSVTRTGIYELPHGVSATNVNELIALAGGPLIANAYDISKAMLDRDGTTRLIPVPRNEIVRSGEIVFVDPSRTSDVDRVSISGAVVQETPRPLSTTRSANDLFRSVGDLLPTAYTPFALVVRRSAQTNAKLLLPISLTRVLDHTSNVQLQSYDTVFVFTLDESRALARDVTKSINVPYVPPNLAAQPSGATPGSPAANPSGTPAPSAGSPTQSSTGTVPPVDTSSSRDANLAALDPRFRSPSRADNAEDAALAEAQALGRKETGSSSTANAEPGNANPPETDDQIVNRLAAALRVPREALESSVTSHIVWILDQVHAPGPYPVAEGTTLPEIIEAAGGANLQADASDIEVTSTAFDTRTGVSQTTRQSFSSAEPDFRTAMVRPLDVVRLREVYAERAGETVTIAGQVRYPGVFDITREERLSSVLQRAGGMTEVAFPYGAIFTRRSTAIREQEGNNRTARELESQIAVVVATPSQNNATAGNLSYLSQIVDELRNTPALGRMSITADPVVLAARPDLDIILEPGDSLFIPKRPSSVTVTGEVLNPGSFQFREALGYHDYLREAGGTSQNAYASQTFIVLPDGSAVPVEDSWLTFGGSGHIPPGSTIVVPRDLRPFDWESFLKDASQIMSQLAVAAASLAVLRNN